MRNIQSPKIIRTLPHPSIFSKMLERTRSGSSRLQSVLLLGRTKTNFLIYFVISLTPGLFEEKCSSFSFLCPFFPLLSLTHLSHSIMFQVKQKRFFTFKLFAYSLAYQQLDGNLLSTCSQTSHFERQELGEPCKTGQQVLNIILPIKRLNAMGYQK